MILQSKKEKSMLETTYKALKPVRFSNKQYFVGNIIPAGVIFPSRVNALIEAGVIEESKALENMETLSQAKEMLDSFGQAIMDKVDKKLAGVDEEPKSEESNCLAKWQLQKMNKEQLKEYALDKGITVYDAMTREKIIDEIIKTTVEE